MKDVHFAQYAPQVYEKLTRNGVFLVAGDQNPNPMTIGWGGLNFYWRKPLFVAPVRASRHTHHLMEGLDEFTIGVPLNASMAKELAFCGTRSGRDTNKFESLGLTAQPAKTVRVPVIGQCDLIYECRVVYRQNIDPSNFLDASTHDVAYGKGDYHTLYYGEITACYLNHE